MGLCRITVHRRDRRQYTRYRTSTMYDIKLPDDT